MSVAYCARQMVPSIIPLLYSIWREIEEKEFLNELSGRLEYDLELSGMLEYDPELSGM